MNPLNVEDYARLAEQALEPGPYGYYAGGAEDEWTLRENREAFRRLLLRPRVLVDVGDIALATTVLGTNVSMPILVGPLAFQRLANADGEKATARAAAAADTIMCLSTLTTTTPAEVAAGAPEAPRWFQLYWFRDEGVTRGLVDQAVEHGYRAIVLTVDAPVAARRERDLRNDFRLPPETRVASLEAALGGPLQVPVHELFHLISPSIAWRDLERLAGWSRLPLVVKGVMTAEDALLACEHGAGALVVSNHGGRQLDGVAATIELLPEVVDAVAGRIEVLLDGGVRRGTDVAKALALGARAVLIGRAFLWGLAVDGEAGVARVLQLLRDELTVTLALLGCATPADVTAAHVRRAGSPS
jgi:isopentenyl diphosphate isomerase/L-lactate dehydrogenase-like FMN-dependent dehydrogenase